ncbi:hypothetical protein E2R51_04750 [Jeotgalibacillus sp. S-D1]|uniref:flagellar FlbD family protein n=1 Tax=Jeotgalibacillus sp. S-D1 TaxID=2552189 RepID=UPI00105AA1EE|nr:flagellar FlbD family protein [Jeotgalibacillus sp. S-D1]TDL35037.1 hypothetical protein E2R51_04750 [Jeotgalibacillus sp. S-D1]
MINVTRLNGKEFIINALYIETVESFPDTMITMTNGKKIIVKDSVEYVQKEVANFYRSIQVLNSCSHTISGTE